jgi:DNA-binding response OmpR family regulator
MVSPDGLQSETLPPIVLLVDREADILSGYTAHFEASGLWVATSTDPVEALDAVQELKPDLLITDAFESRDFDLVATVKSSDMPLPIILLSRGPLRDLPLPTRDGADLCLEKPVLPEALLQNSRALLDRSRSLRGRAGESHERAAQLVARSADVVRRELSPKERRCPRCGSHLAWIERGRLYGMEYDYYRWCDAGCGLYCYEIVGAKWVKLA